jgi:type VI protein secretion system component VasK
MGLAFRQFKTYSKAFVILVIALAVASVIVMNLGNTADVWFFHHFGQINVLWLMLVSGASAVLIVWSLRLVRKVAGEVRELRQIKQSEAKLSEQRRLAEELKQQELRIDAKLKESIAQPMESSDSKPSKE